MKKYALIPIEQILNKYNTPQTLTQKGTGNIVTTRTIGATVTAGDPGSVPIVVNTPILNRTPTPKNQQKVINIIPPPGTPIKQSKTHQKLDKKFEKWVWHKI